MRATNMCYNFVGLGIALPDKSCRILMDPVILQSIEKLYKKAY